MTLDLRLGDCLEVMRTLPDASVDLVVTSPPYNLRMTINGVRDFSTDGKWANADLAKGYADYADDMPDSDYVAWQRECLAEMMRLISITGAIFYNHKWRIQGGLLDDRRSIVEGFPVRQIIIWQRKGGMNFNAGYFVPTYEVIYLIAKKDFALTSKSNGMGDVWTFAQQQNSDHPAPFPLQLPYRCISSTSAKTILDPFMGSGTTGLAARQLNRDFIGIEKSEKYFQMAEKRLNVDVVQKSLWGETL